MINQINSLINGIYSLMARTAEPENLEENNCPICLDSFGDYENAITTRACKHTFHTDCIETSLKFEKQLHNRAICPVCRGDLSKLAKKFPSLNIPDRSLDNLTFGYQGEILTLTWAGQTFYKTESSWTTRVQRFPQRG